MSGQSLWLIAHHYKVDVERLRALNNMGETSTIYIGQKDPDPAAADPNPDEYSHPNRSFCNGRRRRPRPAQHCARSQPPQKALIHHRRATIPVGLYFSLRCSAPASSWSFSACQPGNRFSIPARSYTAVCGDPIEEKIASSRFAGFAMTKSHRIMSPPTHQLHPHL